MKRKLWAGFTGGHIDILEVDTGFGGFAAGAFAKVPAVFVSKKEAQKQYEDVRQVEVELVISS